MPENLHLMKPETIQTLHPNPDKTGRKITLNKYNFIKDHILNILEDMELTHTELFEELSSRAKDNFEGSVHWYGETVKLDLEARNIIERVKSKPEKYRLHGSKSKE
jgi:hypothetical protein